MVKPLKGKLTKKRKLLVRFLGLKKAFNSIDLIDISPFKSQRFALLYLFFYMANKTLQLIAIALLVAAISSKYSDSPVHSFSAINTESGVPLKMLLSADSDRIGVFAVQTNASIQQIIYGISGSKQCSSLATLTMEPIGFPSQTNLLYLDASDQSLVKMSSPCGNATTVAKLSATITRYAVGSTKKESYATFADNNNTFTEYNIGQSKVRQTYEIGTGEKAYFLRYSHEAGVMWIGVQNADASVKIVSFDTTNGKSIHSFPISAAMGFLQGNNKGDAFVGYLSGVFYNMGLNGTKTIIHSLSAGSQLPLGICTNDNLLLLLKVNGQGVQLHTYATGTEKEQNLVQSISIGFVPGQLPVSEQIIECNNDYLTFVDTSGNFQIFKYNAPSPNPDDDGNFPVWVIILIVVGVLAIVGGVVGFYIYKKKKAAQNGGYQKFGSENKV